MMEKAIEVRLNNLAWQILHNIKANRRHLGI